MIASTLPITKTAPLSKSASLGYSEIKIARGKKPEIVKLVYGMMEGERPDLSSLNEEEVKYAKTVRVLNGESLYSHSWLEI